MKRLLLFLGILILFATEILRVYFIMPFPGSQRHDSIDLAYFIDHNRLWLRLTGLALVGYALLYMPRRRNPYEAPRRRSVWPAIGLSFTAILYAIVFYFFNFRMEADKMFYQPGTRIFANAAASRIPANRLVIGVVVGDKAAAYPIQLIGYHHQVRDTVGGTPIMVTYCTVCRTGRVYSPMVNGRPEKFRLVGMDHFNAMFEDATTKSWWQQATGAAVAGPLKGMQLVEIPSAQYTLAEWVRLHPGTKIMQPDPAFADEYADLADYDIGTIKGGLEHRDSVSWKAKSWVIGVRAGDAERAYDWNDLQRRRLIQDSIGATPVLLCLDTDSNFHAWSRVANGRALSFTWSRKENTPPELTDIDTRSLWNEQGTCVEGALKGQQLQPLPAYQEFWHSWSHFHPNTTAYKP